MLESQGTTCHSAPINDQVKDKETKNSNFTDEKYDIPFTFISPSPFGHLLISKTKFQNTLTENRIKKIENTVIEVSIRYMIKYHSSAVNSSYLIFIKEKDPSVDFIKRFTDLKSPPVKAGSNAIKRKINNSYTNWDIIDKNTNKPAVVIGVGEIEWHSQTKIKISTEYRKRSLEGGGYVLTVEKKNSAWAVSNEERWWVS